MRARTASCVVGVVIYEGVEPIDVGGTIGVLSMARRVLPELSYAVIAKRHGSIRLAGGLQVEATYSFSDAPDCDVTIVCGGPGWEIASRESAMLEFLRSRPPAKLASVCTGAMILAAAGCLEGRLATTRRSRIGDEFRSPLDVMANNHPSVRTKAALVADDTVVTGGGVSLAIDTTLHLIAKFYGDAVRDEVAIMIEYDRAFRANRDALGIVTA